jgi:hypothetical protein
MEIVLVKKQPQGPKAAHDTPVVFDVQHFFNCGINTPMGGHAMHAAVAAGGSHAAG